MFALAQRSCPAVATESYKSIPAPRILLFYFHSFEEHRVYLHSFFLGLEVFLSRSMIIAAELLIEKKLDIFYNFDFLNLNMMDKEKVTKGIKRPD